MKKITGIVLAGLLYCNIGFAEIIFKNCNLSPNTGQTDFYIYLEKNEMEMRDETGDIRIFAIDNNKMSEVTVSRLIAWPSDKEISENYSKHEQNLFFNYMNEQIQKAHDQRMKDFYTGNLSRNDPMMHSTSAPGPRTRQYSNLPEIITMPDGRTRYVGSAYKSYGQPSFFGNLFSLSFKI